jgi:hypothetical protein
MVLVIDYPISSLNQALTICGVQVKILSQIMAREELVSQEYTPS